LWEKKILISDIDKIGISTVIHNKNIGTVCTIWQGVKLINFAENISEIEQEWLIEEIKYFLKQIYSASPN